MPQAEFNKFFERAIDQIVTRLLPSGSKREEFEAEVFGRIGEKPPSWGSDT
jgi:chemotaxis receptor (MCP) glutamine deamidase CheD